MKNYLKFKVLPFLLFFLLKFLYFTYRIKVEGDESLIDEKKKIIVFWHSKMLPLIPFLGKREIVALVSMSEDGELISGVLRRFKYILVRGSTSRGGGRAIVKLLKKLNEGYAIAITPDGPRGPSRVFQKGAALLSKKSGAEIIPLSYLSSKSYFFNSWDKFELPLPFSKITIKIGTPFLVSANDDIEEKSKELANILNELES